MRAIGFKNFRKFTNFPMMEFAPITIFVGGNNAGKSTVVKGLLSLTDFLKSMPYGEIEIPYTARERQDVPLDAILKQKKKLLKEQKFYFNTNPYTHIGTFERAQNNVCGTNNIIFDCVMGNFVLSIEVIKDKGKELSYGHISKVRIKDMMFNIEMHFDLFADIATVDLHSYNGNFDHLEIKSMKRYFEALKSSSSFQYVISDYWTTDAPTLPMSLLASFNTAIGYTLAIPELSEEDLNDLPFSRRGFYAPKAVEGIAEDAKEAFKAVGTRPMPSAFNKVGRESYRYFRFEMPSMHFGVFLGLNIEYIYSHAVSQNVWYVAGATDYLSKTVHEFATEQHKKHKRELVELWMNEEHFNIGKTFEIISVGGEAFQVKITDFDGSVTDLADKGMGTIQLMVLLFRLAIALPSRRRNRTYGMGSEEKTPQVIIVEEPEQNIHPKLQSLLADLFYEMFTDYGFRFIVETHSEYLVRKTQVKVMELAKKTQTLTENPFKVYFFNSINTTSEDVDKNTSLMPYKDMKYRVDGKFDEEFGKGFFDEATRLAFQILC